MTYRVEWNDFEGNYHSQELNNFGVMMREVARLKQKFDYVNWFPLEEPCCGKCKFFNPEENRCMMRWTTHHSTDKGKAACVVHFEAGKYDPEDYPYN